MQNILKVKNIFIMFRLRDIKHLFLQDSPIPKKNLFAI